MTLVTPSKGIKGNAKTRNNVKVESISSERNIKPAAVPILSLCLGAKILPTFTQSCR